ncbi:MAG: S41 family peptidase [Winogradskyella arenosi]
MISIYPLMAQEKAFISTEKAIADIDYMIETIEKVHYNPYFMVSKGQFNQSKEELLGAFNQDSIPLKTFIATGMKLVSQLSGGHTVMDWQNRNLMPELMPYKFIPFSGKLVNNNQDFEVTKSALLDVEKGMHIASINGISMVDLYKECMSYFGGIESFKNVNAEKTLPLFLFFTDKIEAPYRIKIKDGKGDFETLGIDISEINNLMTENQPKANYTFEMLKDNIGLISYNSCQGYDAFDAFLKETFASLKTKNITKLIIDIRENGGGDSSLNDLLLSYITTTPYRQSSGRFWKVSTLAKEIYNSNSAFEKLFGKAFLMTYNEAENQSIIEDFEDNLVKPITPENYFNGTTCFLIGPSTFSSANFLADAVKTYKLSTLIGTATGEYTNDFGELLSFELPNSGNYVYVSSTYDIGANGKSDIFEPVFPDIKAEKEVLSFAIDWIENID